MIKHFLAADAAKIDFDFGRMRLPKLGSPKIDGFRCWVRNGVAETRNLTPLQNYFTCRVLSDPGLNGLDGELVCGAPNGPGVFARAQSAFKRRDGEPDFTFHVFDDASERGEYRKRLKTAERRIARLGLSYVRLVPQTELYTVDNILEFEQHHIGLEYEGIMLRSPDGHYRPGRSTPTQDDLWKVKRFIDGEAVVTGLEEALLNENVAERDATGRLKRSSAQAGRTQGKGMVGAVLVNDPDWGPMRLSPGIMTHNMRRRVWEEYEFMLNCKNYEPADREAVLIGRTAHWRAFGYGTKDKPRFPRFYGVRDGEE